VASRPWKDADRAFLETLADRRDWIEVALKRFPTRTEAAIRCMMQKVRIERGMNERDQPNAWMADVRAASQMLLEAQIATGQMP
jgi:hypothetical protein